ncbi:packaged DNA stabilization protein [Acetobacter orientalis]|uniref:packaged DNA stabilization protein n=1 Tax=Acetobacter orientalis TaxID=146474 RepID=UPI00386FC848
MMRINLSGGSYDARAVSVAAQRCLNLYPEPLPQQEQEPAQFAHYPTPGRVEFATPEVGTVRCLYRSTQGDLIASVGIGIYVVHANGNSTKIGTISSGTGQVRMQDNGTALFIVDGSTSGGWYCSLPSKPQQGLYGALTKINDGAFYGSRTIAILDTFFLYTNPDTTNWYVGPAQFADESTTPFDSLYVASKTSYPDTIVGIAVVGQTIWLFGSQETELWYTSGAADFPFQRLPSLSIGSGCASPYSIAANGDIVLWLGADKSGLPRVYAGVSQAAQPVSTYAIENAIQGYTDCSSAIGYIYQQEGHTFYVLTFPVTGKTWVYDVSTSLWHERCSLAPDGVTEAPLRASAWANAYGKVFCGDPENGTIYEVSLDLDTDAGQPIKRQRAFPHVIGDGQRMIHRKLMLDMQNGSGAAVNVDWSDDRGKTFCTPIALQLGASGNVWPTLWRLGLARDRVYRMTWAGGGGAALMGAFLEADTVAT